MKHARDLLVACALLTFFLGPFLWQALTSLGGEGDPSHVVRPGAWTLDAYRSVLQQGSFLKVIGNSLAVALATTLFCLTVGASAAFALAKLPFRGRTALLGLALSVSMFPPIATVSPLYLGLRALGLRDSLVGLVIPYATFALPMTLWLLTSYFQKVPDVLYRAARVDGCTPFQAFRLVLLPLIAPGLATTGLLVFIFSWNEFLYALTFLSSPDRRTIPVAMSLFAGEHREPWAELAAASLLATLPLISLTLVFQRHIVSGLTAGAVKE